MKILVTGGAGYIGSHAVRALARAGHEVLVYDNLSLGHRFAVRNFPLTVGDIGEYKTVRRALEGVDAVMHFAAYAYVGESIENPRKYFDNNVCAAMTLANACVDAGVRCFVFSSTCAVYGEPATLPITENTIPDPVNPYGLSKLAFERLLDSYHRAYGLNYVALRYFNAAGADESGDVGEVHHPETRLIPRILEAANGDAEAITIYGDDYGTPDGTCIRDYIHVNDLADAHVRALAYLASGGQSRAINLGTGIGASVGEVIDVVETVTGKPVRVRLCPRRPGDPPALVADVRCAREVLGWRAQRNLTDIVSTAWLWYLKKKSKPEFIS